MLSGQVSEPYKFEESLDGFIFLSEEQSAALRSIGRELASKKAFYRSIIDNEEDDDQLNTDQEGSPSIIRCEHVGNGRHKLKFLNVIGTISLPNMTFHVLPKIPLNHFAHLAKHAFEEPRLLDSHISIDSLDAFWEVLANWCVASIEKIYWRGLISDYQVMSDDLLFIKGRVDPARTSAQYMRGNLKASCTFDELSIDNPFNRTLKAALVAISRSNTLQDYGLKSRASRLEKRFTFVGEATRQDIKVKVDRRTQYYENALELSNMFLSGNGVDINAGLNHGKSFLIPTPGLVESAIRKILSTHLAPITVRKQKLVIESDPFYSINPDLVFNNGAVTGDVKYKTAGKDWVRNDVAQATMFAIGFEAKAALIISFSKSQHTLDTEMMMGHLPVHRINWNASDLIDPIVAEEELLAKVRAFLLRYRATETGWQRTV